MKQITSLPEKLQAENIRKLEQQFEENEKTLEEKSQNLLLQLCLIRKFRAHPLLQGVEEKIKLFEERKKEIQSFYANQYLKEKVEIEEAKQYQKIIKDLEQRLVEVRMTVFDKQVEISIDHVGKKKQEKTYLNNIKCFNSYQNQKDSIKQLIEMKQKLRAQLPIKKIEEKAVSYESKSSFSAGTNPENQTLKGKVLLLNSEAKMVQNQKQKNDPLLGKLLKLFRKECAKENKMKEEGKKMKQLYAKLKSQKKELLRRLEKKELDDN